VSPITPAPTTIASRVRTVRENGVATSGVYEKPRSLACGLSNGRAR
jgi:hypothetical protein